MQAHFVCIVRTYELMKVMPFNSSHDKTSLKLKQAKNPATNFLL